MSAEMISASAGVILSLLFSYVPGLSAWYAHLGETQDGGENVPDGGTQKRLLMLGLLALVAGGAFALACAGWGAMYGLAVTCDKQGGFGLFQALLLAVMANQATYTLSPRRRG